MAGMAEAMLPLIENPNDLRLDGSPSDAAAGVVRLLLGVAGAVAPVFGILAAGAVISALGQGPFVFASERVRPKLSNVSPMGGWNRLFSRQALIEFAKSLVKLAVIAVCAWIAAAPYIGWTEGSVSIDVAALPGLLRDITLRLLLAVLLPTVVMAAVDIVWNRMEWRRRMRMSFQEIKDEFKQTEGDPHLKARVREIRRSRSRRRMMAAVPEATVILTNPTHFAVALRYERGVTPAPMCVTKGADLIAKRIREIAEEAGVPIVENPPLARALHAAAEVDEAIPVQHYQAVAEVMMYVMRLRAGTSFKA